MLERNINNLDKKSSKKRQLQNRSINTGSRQVFP